MQTLYVHMHYMSNGGHSWVDFKIHEDSYIEHGQLVILRAFDFCTAQQLLQLQEDKPQIRPKKIQEGLPTFEDL